MIEADRCTHGTPWITDCPACETVWSEQVLRDRAEHEWQRGFPPKGGTYLALLADGEQCVTRWNDGGERYLGDRIKPGWPCLNVKVVAWAFLLPQPSWARKQG